jgi:hypothetical protein
MPLLDVTGADAFVCNSLIKGKKSPFLLRFHVTIAAAQILGQSGDALVCFRTRRELD